MLTDSETVCPDSSAKCCRSRSSIKWRKVCDSSVPKGGKGTSALALPAKCKSGDCYLWVMPEMEVVMETSEGGGETLYTEAP